MTATEQVTPAYVFCELELLTQRIFNLFMKAIFKAAFYILIRKNGFVCDIIVDFI